MMMMTTTMGFRVRSSSARTVICSVSAFMCVAFLSSLGHAATIFDIEEVSIETDGISQVIGSLDIIIGLTDPEASNPADVAAFNFDVIADGPISFTGISNPTVNPLFANPTLTPNMLGTNVRGTGDTANASTLADGLHLVTLEFSAPAGTLGLFPVDFGIPLFNNLSDQSGNLIPLELVAGSIDIDPASDGERRWIGGSGDWNDLGNWKEQDVPNGSDEVAIFEDALLATTVFVTGNWVPGIYIPDEFFDHTLMILEEPASNFHVIQV